MRFQKLLLRHVNVVPMDEERILYDQDVLLEDGAIRLTIPSGSLPIEAREEDTISVSGQYLMPGLHDCHVHVGCGDDLEVFLSYGITMVLNMMGASSHLRWREELRAGQRFGCDLLSAGPILDGVPYYVSFMPFVNAQNSDLEERLYPEVLYQQGVAPVPDVRSARRAVRYTKAAGYDFVKIYNNIDIPVYRAICDEAQLQDIRVVGHLPDCISADYPQLGPRGDLLQYGVDHISSINQKDLLKLRTAGAWIDPTISVESVFFDGIYESEAYQCRIAELNPLLTKSWEASKERHMAAYTEHPRAVKVIRRGTEYYGETIRKYLDMGGRIISGTDGAMDYLMTGYSLHLELDAYLRIGLTPYEVLRTSTCDAAAFLGTSSYEGTIASGKRARLLLLDSNPLDGMDTVHDFAAVIKDDTLLTREDCAAIRKRSAKKMREDMEFA